MLAFCYYYFYYKQGHPTQSLKTLFEFEIAVSKARFKSLHLQEQEHCFF